MIIYDNVLKKESNTLKKFLMEHFINQRLGDQMLREQIHGKPLAS
jgi:hypothetical protein